MQLKNKEEKNLRNFSARLKEAMGSDTLRVFEEKSGISNSALSSYLNNKSFPTLDRLYAISNASGKPVEWLTCGNALDPRMYPVYQYDLTVSAGEGGYIEHENPVAKFEFSEDWLRSQNLFNKKLSIVPVTGDSMEPTLCDGDLIMIRHHEVNDGVCVIRINGLLMVKRVQHDFIDNSYEIISDNPRYKPRVIPSSFDGDFEIIGQVVRVLQRVKQHDTVQ